MKTLVLIPDPATAYGLSDLLVALGDNKPRVIAYGSATAAVLPAGLDLYVYPIRDGSRLPGPFLEALLEHEKPQALLAPTGAITRSSVPTLLIDLDPRVAIEEAVSSDPGGHLGWIEAVTGTAERRPALLRGGLFSVDYAPHWFEAPGKLSPTAAGPLMGRLADLANLSGQGRAALARPDGLPVSEPSVGASFGSSGSPVEVPVTIVDELPPTNAELNEMIDAMIEPAYRPIPEPVLNTGPIIDPPTEEAVPGLAELAEAVEVAISPLPPVAKGSIDEPTTFAETRLAITVEAHRPERYRGRNNAGTAIVLASLQGLDHLTAQELAHATVIAVPETLAWLTARMGIAQYVCMAQEPRTLEAAAALSTVRSIVVHADQVPAESLAPRARARVPVIDLSRGGGLPLGWSDELQTGFFPTGGDAALALQWAIWVGVAEVVLAGAEPLEQRPGWSAFWQGTQTLLAARGIKVHTPERAATAVSVYDTLGRFDMRNPQ